MVLELEAGDGNIKYGVLDSSLWHKRGDTGPSLAEQMIMKGCRFNVWLLRKNKWQKITKVLLKMILLS